MNSRDRYPGPRPFADDPIDQGLFFGRERESEEVCNRILVDPLLVLFGKSGLGKTSLLRAGVFPRLRGRDLLPVPVRLNRPEVPLLQAVREALEQACQAQGIAWRPVAPDDLWTLFKTVVLWRGESLQTPVLVFDQFEELFTLHSPKARRGFALAIAELLGVRLPDGVRERMRAGERLPYGEGPPALRLVLSLREDHLGALEELAAELPSVLENRVRLIALDESAALAAIQEPGGLPRGEDLASPPLRFTEPALTALLGFLKGRSGIIEPFQLQVLCNHLERAAVRNTPEASELVIDAPDLGGDTGMAAVLGDFYRSALGGLSGRLERRRARNLCEWGLLSQDGRRLPMEEGEIKRQYGIDPETLERLVDARLLRSEPRLEGVFYELSHDTLAASALRNRRWRLPKGIKYGILALLLAAAVLVLGITEQERRRADQARAEAEGLAEFMVIDLRDKLEPIGRLDLMRDINARVESYYQHLGGKAQDLSTQRRRMVASNNRGDNLLARGDLSGAWAAFEEGLLIAKRLASSDPSNAGWQRDLSVSLEKVGNVKAAQGDLAGALAVYAEGKAIRERLAGSDPSNTGWQSDLSASLDRVGDVKSAQGDLTGALAAYAESEAIRERLAGSDPSNAGWQRDLSASLDRAGDVKQAQGDLAGALAAYTESKAIRERLVGSDPSNAGWQRDLSVSLEKVGNVKAAQGDLAGALAVYAEGKAIRERLAGSDPSNTGWQSDLSASLDRVGDVKSAQGDLTGALAAYAESEAIRERLAGSDPSNAGWQSDLSASLGRVGDVKSAQGDLTGALAAYAESEAIRERLAGSDPSNAGWQRDLSASLDRVGDVKQAQGDLAGALAAYTESKAIRERLVGSDPSNASWQSDLSASLDRVGDLKAAQGDLAGALAAYAEGKAIRERLAGSDPSNASWQSDLSASLDRVGDLKAAQGDLAGALAAYAEGKAIRERLAGSDPSNAGWQRDLSVSLEKVGDIKAAQGDLAGALAAYAEGKAIRERLAGSDPSNAGWQRDLSVSLEKVGDIKAAQGDLAGAVAAYAESKAIRERLAGSDPSNAQWQSDLVVSLWKLSREGLAKPEQAIGHLEQALEILGRLEADGRLNAQQKDWPEQLRQRLKELQSPKKQVRKAKP